MARFYPLFSSSSGNCTYIGGASGGILIDAGVSAKRIVKTLTDIGADIHSIGAIFITHEHTDHINGLKVLAGRYGIDVYTSAGTLLALGESDTLTPRYAARPIPAGGIEVCGMHVRSFATSHDSRESVGYVIMTADGRRIAVATDTGVVTPEAREALDGCDLVMLESNHDIRMLENGPYPYYLKRRILSDKGHLSNDCCAETVKDLLESGTTRFILGHLSKENNFPRLAYITARAALCSAGAEEGRDFELFVAGDNGNAQPLIF